MYLKNQQANGNVNKINDAANFKQILKAMEIIELTSIEQREILQIIASILHMGNVGFNEDDGLATILKPEYVAAISKLLRCDEAQLNAALTIRTIEARGDLLTCPHNREMAIFARDALAKAVYDRLFTWLVSRINTSLHTANTNRRHNVMGILDIYGFEIFEKNSFEQFCINYCNEKLQQLFIELTLKSEQEEYLREDIEWEPVTYFDNKIICELIEMKNKGIIAIMDEECLRPGERTDATFLNKLNDRLGDHKHCVCHRKSSTAVQKTMDRDDFRLIHYAGDVTYNVAGFLDKNNDRLFRDLKHVMSQTQNSILSKCFPANEYLDKKRPITTASQFKISLNNLMDILVCKEPSYIRCIKPNDLQSSGIFDDQLVLHQVKYLGLMENLRVRRAGFAYRRNYEMFLRRYKCLSDKTWPHYNGSARDGVQVLVNELAFAADDYRMGRRKIFIRHPRTLFRTEDAFQMRKNYVAAIIQSRWKGRQQRAKYLQIRQSAIVMQTYARRYLAQRRAAERREAVEKIRAFIKGFITRHDPPNKFNEAFIAHAKRLWLMKLSKNLPKTLLNYTWIGSPWHCADASVELKEIYRRHMVRVYTRNLSAEKKRQFELKVMAESVFKGNKKNYLESVGPWFIDERVAKEHMTQINNFVSTMFGGAEKLYYVTPVIKYDRHGYKPRERFLLLGNSSLYLLDAKTYKIKHRLPLNKIDFCVSSHKDNMMVVRIPDDLKKDKGDLILEIPAIIECCIWIIDVTMKRDIITIFDTAS